MKTALEEMKMKNSRSRLSLEVNLANQDEARGRIGRLILAAQELSVIQVVKAPSLRARLVQAQSMWARLMQIRSLESLSVEKSEVQAMSAPLQLMQAQLVQT